VILCLCEWWTRARRRQRSPILALDENVGASPSKLAPERANELKVICEKQNLEIMIVDRPKFGIQVHLDTHKIDLPIAAMEYVWAQSYRFWVIAQEYKLAQHAGMQKFDLRGNKRLDDAARLVEWSGQNVQTTGDKPWPIDLPRPERYPGDEDRRVANELFLGAMGWIILHEVGHVYLGHAELAGAYSQQQEKEADIFATAWILDRLNQSDPRLIKRMFCIAAGLLCLQSFETVAAPRWHGTHPPAHERISYCLDPYRSAGAEKIAGFLVVCLQALFAETGVSPDIEGESFDDILDGLLVSITRRNS
jgi:hypothetical protein